MKKWIMSSVLALATMTGAAQAQDWYFEYGSWNVHVEEIDTGEDLRLTCRAFTGGDGYPSVSVWFSNGDAGPPDYFPSVVVEESAVRHQRTVAQDGDPVYVRFDDNDVMDSVVSGYTDEQGFQHASIPFYHPQSQWVLQAMRRNGQMDVVVNHKVLTMAFLDGFTAAYLKAAESCGFDGRGVVN